MPDQIEELDELITRVSPLLNEGAFWKDMRALYEHELRECGGNKDEALDRAVGAAVASLHSLVEGLTTAVPKP